uniref:Putative hetero-Diels-Alderase asR5 n=1 Tax=Sarocladium schorii TaxID=2203296 RepID=ASR5_SARSH|nr:RecName: Full=Putative hetero-Diels-Alderase asR5; AltName: Full=Xenovulene A biosynthesis cluster protein R5; Flags: Precursor [Sarocladium sp. 'schorii']AWM95794.1 putative hetero-diels alderase [Sarocladium sp. 'schorii']
MRRSFLISAALGLSMSTPALAASIQSVLGYLRPTSHHHAPCADDVVLKQSAGSDSAAPDPLPSRVVHNWPNGTWIENISVRPNGNLLVSQSTPRGRVWQVKEPWLDEPKVELAYDFDEWVDRIIGIGETTPDKYVVVGSRFYSLDPQSSQVERTFCAMELDFTKGEKPSARLVARFPHANLLQSVSALPWDRSVVLISDQYLLHPRADWEDLTPGPGQIWRLDTKTGHHEIVMTNYAEMNTTYNHGLDVGINGIKIHGDHLYWINMDTGGAYRVRIDKYGYPTPLNAVPETLGVAEDALWDDFAMHGTRIGEESDDTTMFATSIVNLMAISPENGTIVPLAGVGTSEPMGFPGPTSAQFGRTEKDSHILYVTGKLFNVPPSIRDVVIQGWVRAIDTTGFHF